MCKPGSVTVLRSCTECPFLLLVVVLGSSHNICEHDLMAMAQENLFQTNFGYVFVMVLVILHR